MTFKSKHLLSASERGIQPSVFVKSCNPRLLAVVTIYTFTQKQPGKSRVTK